MRIKILHHLFYALLLEAQIVQANELDELLSMSLEELINVEVTVAARKAESWLSSSGTVYVIDRSEIETYGWRDLKEILASVPNMDYFSQWSWLPGGQRGFTGNMSGTLMLIDGREVQNLLANEAFIMNNFPAARIEKVEILQGPNSTLYGGNATQGVINVITGLDQKRNEASFLIGEVNTKHGHLIVNQVLGYGNLSLSASYFTSKLSFEEIRNFIVDDNEFSRNDSKDMLRNHNADDFRNREDNITVDARFNNKHFYLGTNLTRTENVSGIEAVAYDYTTGDDSRRGYSNYYFGTDIQAGENLTGNIEVSFFSEYKEKDRLNAIIHKDAIDYSDLTLFTEREDIGPSERIRLKTQWHYLQAHDQDWTFGYDGWRTQIGRKIKYRQTDTGTILVTPESWPTDKEESNKHAIYGQYSKLWKFDDKSIKVNAGLRYHEQDFTNASWLPRFNLVFQPNLTQAIKFTYGKAFRPPTIFEFDLVEDDAIESQVMRMYELNWSKAFNWQDIQFTHIIALYQMQAKNFYQKKQEPNSGNWFTEVTGEHSVSGLENLLTWKTKRWQGQLSFRLVDPDETEVNTQSEALDIPKYKVKFGSAYRITEKWKIAIFIDHWDHSFTEANKYNAIGTEIVKIPSWTTANLNINFQNKAWLLGFYIENLFDKKYFHSNARGTSPVKYIQAPRNIRLSVKYNF